MVVKLLVVWFLGVVSFFVLWAATLKVIKRISKRKSQTEDSIQEEQPEKEALSDHAS